MATVIEKIFHSDIQALRDTLSVLDPVAMAKAAKLIRTAEHVEIYGIGNAAPITENIQYRLLRSGLKPFAALGP